MPEHFDFLRRALSLHSFACEATLLADNAARLFGVSVPDSVAFTYTLMERIRCTF